jgi:lysine 2,3-aminomutase
METQASTRHATDVPSVEKNEDHPPHLSTFLGPLFDGQILPEPSVIHHHRISGCKPLVSRRPNTSARVRLFRRAFFPEVSDSAWNDWRWQIRNRIQDLAQFDRMLALSNDERAALDRGGSMLPVGVTPYFMSLLSHDNANQALRRSVIPTMQEFVCGPGESADPLAEEDMSPLPGLVHRYPDRVLLLVSDFCSTYCRYCTRSRVVGHGIIHPAMSRLERVFEYVRVNPQIRDVLISGGEPLCLSDDRLDWILTELRRIPHVEIVRIGTKAPVVLPQRITPQLTRMLRRHHPVWMSIHFTHPDECTAETIRACAQLADAGIPLGSQTVLLKGINDDVETMKKLVHRLMTMRVRPYYIYQCDPICGSAHFRTSVESGLEIIRGLRGFTSGYAVPTFVIDAPGGGGKIPVMPEYVAGREGDYVLLRNYEGKVYRYYDPVLSTEYANV